MFSKIKSLFIRYQNNEKAIAMSRYMKHNFEFLGIPAPLRKELIKPFLKELKRRESIDWDLINQLWQQKEREYQYVVADYLTHMRQYLTYSDLPSLKKLIVDKSWWDMTDSLNKTIGYIGLSDDRVDDVMICWSMDVNFWVRRVAIIYQLGRKEKTKIDVLETILVNNLNQQEFFINKAIGWALRDYSKTNAKWVSSFIDQYSGKGLMPFSVKEGSKYI